MTLPTAAVIRTSAIPELGSNSGEDSNLDTLIARADAVLAGWCGIPAASASVDPTFEATTFTHYLDGPSILDPRALILPLRPVASVTSIHDDTDRDWDYATDDLVDSGDYTLDGVEGKVYLHHDSTHGEWGAGPRRLKVIYSSGYNSGADARITQAIGILVAHWWRSRPRLGLEGYSADGGDTVSTAPSAGIPDACKEILWPIRLVATGLG